MCVRLQVKNILSLLAGKILHRAKRFDPLKVIVLSLISDQTLFKSAEFFFFLATLHSQKIVKEIAYIPTSFQALLKAHFFFFYCIRSTKDNKQKILLNYLFVVPLTNYNIF